jgi:hypothetical protein
MDRPRVSSLRRWSFHLAFVGLGLLAAVTAGCFGGAPVSTSTPGPTTPLPPSQAPFSNSTSVAVQSTSGPTNYNGTTSGGFSNQLTASLSTPQPGTSASLTIVTSSSPPPGVPALALSGRQIEDERSLQSIVLANLYLTYTASQTTNETGDPVFTIGVPNGYPTTGVVYYLAIYQGSGPWAFGYAPGVYNLGFNDLTLTGAYPLMFVANSPITLGLYYQLTTDPVPSPPPSPTPTTQPTGAAGIGLH